jgi:RNA recognition motif-containing protein
MGKAEARSKMDSERTRKLYVGGLPLDINKEELENYFGNFGALVYANPVYSPLSTARGFAFIKYVREEDAMKVLRCKRHIIRGWYLYIK